MIKLFSYTSYTCFFANHIITYISIYVDYIAYHTKYISYCDYVATPTCYILEPLHINDEALDMR